MSKYIKISQQMQEEPEQPQEQKKLSNIDQANIQKLKSLKGTMTTASLMAELTVPLERGYSLWLGEI